MYYFPLSVNILNRIHLKGAFILFVIINIKESGKRKIRKGRTVDKVHEYFTSGGERFYITDVFDSGVGVNWNETASFIGRHSKHVLLDRRIILPENCPVQRFTAEKYRNILLFNTVELILRQMFLAGCRPQCCIRDPKGEYAFLLDKIVRFSAQTTVITENRFRYYPQISDIYTRFGAGVTVTDKTESISTDAVIIDTAGALGINSEMLFSVDKNGFSPKYADGFNELKAMCPPYIDSVDFLGAIYEFNRDKRLESSLCRVLKRKNEDFTVSELSEMFINRKIGDRGRLFFADNLTRRQ